MNRDNNSTTVTAILAFCFVVQSQSFAKENTNVWSTMVPEIEFQKTPPSEAFDRVAKIGSTLSGKTLRVVFLGDDEHPWDEGDWPASEPPSITFRFKNIALAEALQICSDLSGCLLWFKGNTAVAVPTEGGPMGLIHQDFMSPLTDVAWPPQGVVERGPIIVRGKSVSSNIRKPILDLVVSADRFANSPKVISTVAGRKQYQCVLLMPWSVSFLRAGDHRVGLMPMPLADKYTLTFRANGFRPREYVLRVNETNLLYTIDVELDPEDNKQQPRK